MKLLIKDVEFSYDSVPTLHDINLTVENDALLCVLGPNGVGKSTFIHCVNKVLRPRRGVVLLNGEDTLLMRPKEIARKMGYVPQGSTDGFSVRVIDLVLMGRHPHSGLGKEDADLDIVLDILKLLRIEHLSMRHFNELSAGQQQKVLIARGLAQQPEVLLLDEPTSNLDIRHQLEVMEIMRGLVDDKKLTVVMASHDLNISAAYADVIVFSKEGTIFKTGNPIDVFTKENIRSIYGVEADIEMKSNKPFVIPLAAVG